MGFTSCNEPGSCEQRLMHKLPHTWLRQQSSEEVLSYPCRSQAS